MTKTVRSQTVRGIGKASSHQRALVVIATRTLIKQILPLFRYCQMVPSVSLKNSTCSLQTSLAYLIKHITHGLHQRLRSILPVSHLTMSGPSTIFPLFPISTKVFSHPHTDLLVLILEAAVPNFFAQGCLLHLNQNILIPH